VRTYAGKAVAAAVLLGAGESVAESAGRAVVSSVSEGFSVEDRECAGV
jgi:hypothetical protein